MGDTLIIGEGSLKLREIAKSIENSESFAQLLPNWRSFGEKLEVDGVKLQSLQKKLSNENMALENLPRQILEAWKANEGHDATLQRLCVALKDCGVRNIADALMVKFGKTEIKFVLQQKEHTLSQLLGDNVSEQRIQEIDQQIKNAYKKFLHAPVPLIKERFCPSEELVYIERTFSYKTKLAAEIFKDESTKKHIFVLVAKEASQKARVRQMQISECGKYAKQSAAITKNRFVTLESRNNFEAYCNSRNPTHMIELTNNEFFWIESNGRMDAIRMFLKEENNEEFEEHEAVRRITEMVALKFPCIAASPGMGKTFVLANLANTIGKEIPKSVVLFFRLHELMTALQIHSPVSNLELIFQYVSTNHTTAEILYEMWQENSYKFYLFFDGYDQVLQKGFDFVNSLIQNLSQMHNIKVIISTRGNYKFRLEDTFNTLSFEMLPFNRTNQTYFLKRHWITQNGAIDSESLHLFAEKCLSTLELKMKDLERNIAGVPLQCMVLAKVYGEDAKENSEQEIFSEDAVKEHSLLNMYRSLVNLKFHCICDAQLKQMYVNVHVYKAIALLYPGWLEKFKPYLNLSDDIDVTTLNSIGLIDESGFVHQTFAEYMLADFIVGNLNKYKICAEFFIEEILGKVSVTVERRLRRPALYKLKKPVIAFFINLLLQDSFMNNNMGASDFLNASYLETLSQENVCIAAVSSCCNDLEHCFEIIAAIMQYLNIKENCKLWNKCFKHLLHLVVENTKSFTFVKSVLDFMESELEVNHVYQGKYRFGSTLEILECTPVHVAVYQGKLDIFTYLLEIYKNNQEYLLHVCAHKSGENNESIIQQKLLIIDSLAVQDETMIKEEFEGRSPLLQYNVHPKIADKLVNLGLSNNSHTAEHGTVLHIHEACDKITYYEKVRWALEKRFKSINEKDSLGASPLMDALSNFGALDKEVLQMFHEANVDINATDVWGNSVLFYAIEQVISLDFIQAILKLGADPNHINQDGLNAMDLVIQLYKYDPSMMLNLLKLLLSNGFRGFNQGISPSGNFNLIISELQKMENIVEPEILRSFFETAYKTTAENGDSILFHAIQYFKNMDLIRIILDQGVDVSHRNNRGENAAHIILINPYYQNHQILAVILSLLQSKKFEELNQQDNDGHLPIMKAIMIGKVLPEDFLQTLKNSGVDFNAQDKFGDSVLFYAIKFTNDVDFTKKILNFGANLNHTNHLGNNAAHFAMEHYQNDPQIALKFLNFFKSEKFEGFDQKNNAGCTVIMEAIAFGLLKNDEIRQFFLKAQIDFNAEDKYGDSALFYAIKYLTSSNSIQEILELTENPNHKNKIGRNAAHTVIIQHGLKDPIFTIEVLELLDVKEFNEFIDKDFYDDTPLELAINSRVRNNELLDFLRTRTQSRHV